MADLSKEGISKSRKNDQQGYKFRGIDEVLNALSPVLSKHGLIILPRMTGRTVAERATKNGGVLFYVVVEAEFDFVAVVDGSYHTVKTFGEAMDSGDKATNKAMSAAYKYAAFQTFCIPTEGDNDADATTHDVVAQAPAGFDDWVEALEVVADEGTAALSAMWASSKKEFRALLPADQKERLKQRAKRYDMAPSERDTVPA